MNTNVHTTARLARVTFAGVVVNIIIIATLARLVFTTGNPTFFIPMAISGVGILWGSFCLTRTTVDLARIATLTKVER